MCAPMLAALMAASLLAGCEKPATAPQARLDPEAQRLLATMPPAFRTADLANGELHFSLCRSCHTVIAGAPSPVGPNLHGVFGRRAGSDPGYAYSDALRSAGFTWDAEHLNAWLRAPQSYRPGTKMTFTGLKDDKDRTDLIAYLRVASAAP